MRSAFAFALIRLNCIKKYTVFCETLSLHSFKLRWYDFGQWPQFIAHNGTSFNVRQFFVFCARIWIRLIVQTCVILGVILVILPSWHLQPSVQPKLVVSFSCFVLSYLFTIISTTANRRISEWSLMLFYISAMNATQTFSIGARLFQCNCISPHFPGCHACVLHKHPFTSLIHSSFVPQVIFVCLIHATHKHIDHISNAIKQFVVLWKKIILF